MVKNSRLIDAYKSSMFGLACSKFGLEIQESCSKCSKFGVSMFEVFNVRYFGVRSTSRWKVLIQNFCEESNFFQIIWKNNQDMTPVLFHECSSLAKMKTTWDFFLHEHSKFLSLSLGQKVDGKPLFWRVGCLRASPIDGWQVWSLLIICLLSFKVVT